MKKSSQRALSRLLAGVMIVSSLFTNMVYADDGAVGSDDVASGAAVSVYEDEAVPELGKDYKWDLADGTVIPAGDKEKLFTEAIDKGLIKIDPGSNGFRWNDSQHGTQFAVGSSIEVKVAGSGTLKIGGCEYSTGNDITVTSADESFSDTRTLTGKVGCYDQDGSTIDFVYDGPETTLKATFNKSAYVPAVEFIAEKDGFTAGAPEKGTIYTWDLTKEDVDLSEGAHGPMTIAANDGQAPVFHDTQHGSVFWAGNSLTFDVLGNTYIKIGGCQHSQSNLITATSTTGKFEKEAIPGATAKCYDADRSSIDFLYVGEAGTVTLTWGGYTYTPIIKLVPVPYDVELAEWEQKDFSFDLNGKTVTVTGAASSTDNSVVDVVDGEVLSLGTVEASIAADLGGKELSNELITNLTEGYSAAVVDGKIVITLKNEETIPNEYTISVTDNSIVVEAEAGKLYNYNFTDGSVLEQDTTKKLTKFISADGIMTINSPTSFAYYHDASHGAALTVGDSFDFIVAGNALITVGCCQYTAVEGVHFEFTDADGNVLGTTSATTIDKGACGANEFSYKGPKGKITATLKADAASGEIYIHGVSVANEAQVEPSNGKIDVWDFGGVQLDPEKYNNHLSPDIMNGFYDESIAPGTGGVVAPTSFSAGRLSWVGGSNDRFRTTDKSISRYDENVNFVDGSGQALTDFEGEVFTGRLYVNKQADTSRAISILLNADDKVTVYGKTDSGGSLNFVFTDDPEAQTDVVSFAQGFGKYVFYAKEAGTYKLYDTAGKPSYFRILREDAEYAKVSGSVTAPDTIPEGYSVVAVNNETGKKFYSDVTESAYSFELPVGFSYKLGLADANGYVIKTGADVSVADTNDIANDIVIEKVPLVALSGKLVGLDEASLGRVSVVFTATSEDAIYVPDVTYDGDNYSVELEKGMEYAVEIIDVNDYTVAPEKIQYDADAQADLTFTAKPTYKVNVNVEGEDIDAAVLEEIKGQLTFTFTNINEDGYIYSFAAGEDVMLRDGQYAVNVAGYHKYPVASKLIPDVKVNGADSEMTVTFKPVKEWTFNNLNEIIAAEGAYEGLKIEGAAKTENGKSHLACAAGDKISVPVKNGDVVEISYYYKADFNVDGAEAVVGYNSGSTSIVDSSKFEAKEDGFMVIDVTATTYFTKIAIGGASEYRPTLYVGPDKEFKTINEALAEVDNMVRPEDERVEIMIDPGNYEEMLVVNAKNVSLINASADPSIELTNKGVDIDENAVRITSYYGHGYNYYSMTTDCKYDDEVLAVNKANGYLTFENPGSGTTKNSYWNATVTVRGEGFRADNIIFENSFNQYISEKEANDVVVAWESGSKGIRPTTAGDTSVQKKSFVERAAAIAILSDKNIYDNCKFVGRQDTLYGAVGCRAYFKDGVAMGGTDYIFGGMTAVFDGTDLMINTSDDASDVSYITAAQQDAPRGYLMYGCTITSTTPGVDTASAHRAKAFANYFGRPWKQGTSETVFYNTTIETGYDGTPYSGSGILGDVDKNGVITANDASAAYQFALLSTFDVDGRYDQLAADVDLDGEITAYDSACILQKTLISTFPLPGGDKVIEPGNDKSLINGAGWLDSLGGAAPAYDLNTIELGEADTKARVDWATTGEGNTVADGTEITIPNWLGDWDISEEFPPEPESVKVFVVGDSTACHYDENTDTGYWFRRVGFGDALEQYLTDNAEVVNLALSGRSSRSFFTGINENGIEDAAAKTNYARLKDEIGAGDYLIIAWGHNDEKTDDYRFTEPTGSKETAGSFKNSLYENYIKVAQDAGAYPILCTPIIRRGTGTALGANDVHQPAAGDYAQCIRDLASELNIPLIDNLNNTQAVWTELGAGQDVKGALNASDFNALSKEAGLVPTGYATLQAALQNGAADNTHLNKFGASYVAYMMAKDIKALDGCGLSAYVNDGIEAPVFNNDDVMNPTWEAFDESIYVPSTIWKLSAPWAGSVFGESVGDFTEDSHPNFDISENDSYKSVTIEVANNKGKIASKLDGIAMYFQEIPANQNFTLTATAHIDRYKASENQTGFGLMVRDSVFSDYNYGTASNYVAVGNTTQSGVLTPIWARGTADASEAMQKTVQLTELTEAADIEAKYAAGTDVPLTLTRKDGVYTVQYGDSAPYTSDFAGVNLNAINKDSDFVGFFVARNAKVTFNNVNLTLE